MPQNGRSPPNELQGSVMAVKGNGSRRYAIVNLTDPHWRTMLQSTVTFSLSTWQGKHDPEPDQLVILSDIEKFVKGWRARCARPIKLQ